MVERLIKAKLIGVLDAAHAQEHSLEVHLPFLQVALDEFALVPIVAGDASPLKAADPQARRVPCCHSLDPGFFKTPL
jgi:AmmeMemoRadiSam system protein B